MNVFGVSGRTLAKGSTVVWIAEAEAAQSFWGLTEQGEICGGRRDAYAGLCTKGSDYVIYSHRLAQLQDSDPLHTSLFLTRCGMWSLSASRW